MDGKRKLEVTAWNGVSGSTVSERVSRPHRHRVSPRLLGLTGTVLLHVLALQSFLLGTRAIKVPMHLPQGSGSTSIVAEAESELTLVVVQTTESIDAKDSLFEQFASRGPLSEDLPITIISPDPVRALNIPKDLQSEDQDAESPVSRGDPAGRARLFGIYSGQIEARIERAWRRPRTPVNENKTQVRGAGEDDTFRCQVRIIQDAIGNVQEVRLPACNGSIAWQRSLVLAIQQSSPLPAPPTPTVFTNALTMTFTGYAYATGSSPDEYDIEPQRIQAQNVVQHPSAPVPSTHLEGMIQLPDSQLNHDAMSPSVPPRDETATIPFER
jgi:hypothetical protein